MKEIKNKTSRPLRVPLPRGKKLFLGPNMVAQIADGAAKHAELLKLVEAGSIEILGEGESPTAHSSTGTAHEQTHGSTKSFRRSSGDR